MESPVSPRGQQGLKGHLELEERRAEEGASGAVGQQAHHTAATRRSLAVCGEMREAKGSDLMPSAGSNQSDQPLTSQLTNP